LVSECNSCYQSQKKHFHTFNVSLIFETSDLYEQIGLTVLYGYDKSLKVSFFKVLHALRLGFFGRTEGKEGSLYYAIYSLEFY
jgi:hypothetical protein